jgi:transposase
MTSAEYAVSTQGAASGAGRRAGRHRRRQVAEAGGAVQGMVRPHRRFARRLLSPGCPGSASRTAEEQAEMFRRARHGARSRTTVRGRRSRSSSPAPSRKIGWRRAERSICRPSATKLPVARHLIENFFAKLKQFRAIATRYDDQLPGRNLPRCDHHLAQLRTGPKLTSAPCPTPCRARMRGQYLTGCRLRPRPGPEGTDATPARFFLCPLPRSSAHLQLLRSRPDLLCRRLCRTGAAQGAMRGRTAVPNEPPRSRRPNPIRAVM